MGDKKPTFRERALYLVNPEKGNEAYRRRLQEEEKSKERSAGSAPRMSYGSHGASRTLNSLVGWIVNPGDAEDDIDLFSSTLR